MAYEQILTILLGAGVGVAVVLYAVRSRLFGASQSTLSGGSSIETFTVSSQSTSVSQIGVAPTIVAAATQPPHVEAPVGDFLSFGPVPTTSAEIATAGSSDAAIASIDASVVSRPSATSVAGESRTARARAPRASRRTGASPRTSKSRAGGQSIPTTRKALDQAAP
jgi:hypothetical protein